MKIICVGLNYHDHIAEVARDLPAEPVIFLKPDSAILRNGKPFFIPPFTSDIHYEAELVLRICKLGKSVPQKFASRYYDAVTLGIDFTARDLQKKLSAAGMPWEISKTFDGSAPLGSFIPADELPGRGSIPFRLLRNGEIVQDSTSDSMIFSFDAIIEAVSRYYTLKTGDLIFTGTPAGTGRVERNDRLSGYIGDRKVLEFDVK